jgi:hypothetical protein
MTLYVYVSIVEVRYEHFQDLITTLSWPIHAWGSYLPRRLVSYGLSRPLLISSRKCRIPFRQDSSDERSLLRRVPHGTSVRSRRFTKARAVAIIRVCPSPEQYGQAAMLLSTLPYAS